MLLLFVNFRVNKAPQVLMEIKGRRVRTGLLVSRCFMIFERKRGGGADKHIQYLQNFVSISSLT